MEVYQKHKVACLYRLAEGGGSRRGANGFQVNLEAEPKKSIKYNFSMEGLLSELDYFEPNVTQLSVIGEYDRVFGKGQTFVHCRPIEIFVRGADELYFVVNNSKLEIILKITLENGSDISGGDSVRPLNDILNALFMSMEMELGPVLVTDPNTKYSYRAVIENLINYNKLIADTRLLAEGRKKDLATRCEVPNPAGANKGLTARTAWFARSRVVTVIGRSHVDFFPEEKLNPANIHLKLKLIPNTSAYYLKKIAQDHEHPQVNYKVKIMEARLWIRTKHISPSLIQGQERVVQTKN